MKLHTHYNLGPLPWNDDDLVAAAWRNYSQAQDWVNEHPGHTFASQLDSLKAVQRIFEGSAKQFDEWLIRFHTEAQDGRLFRRNRRSDLNAYEQRFQELLYIFASSAMSLVDQARTISRKAQLADYESRVNAVFGTNPKHRFIQELRVDVIHVTLHSPGWQLTSGGGEDSTSKFMIWPKQLTRLPKYNAHARQFVNEHPDGIDIGRLIAVYTSEVREFHEWLLQSIDTEVGPLITDYQRCTRQIKAVNSRSMWNLILQQVVIARKRDPYTYLDQQLTKEELDEVNALPNRSRKQVDRIIELIDEYGACDDELRQIIYKAFGVSG
ncbi:MAG: hypothetical protein KKH12_13990 [Gammaproteobacteria bacterium]|nr:hypothetical protein [Gammaproteobacteria bacterium]MBU1482771.1 hypothetical protein [Gammaproteobacteria bacterium]